MATTHERQESPEYSVFREHYDKLYHAIQDPLPLAVRLYSKAIISSAVMGHMSVVGLSTLEKNNTLLSAVEKQIQVVPQAFHEVLSVLNEEPYMQSLVETMQRSLLSTGLGTHGGDGSDDDAALWTALMKRYEVKAKPTGRQLGRGKYGRVIEPSSAVTDTMLAEQDLHILTEILRPAAPQWKTVGLALGFLDHELTIVECKPLLILEGPPGYFREMLSQWLKWAPPDHSSPNLENLAIAIHKSGHEDLAVKLDRSKHFQRKEPYPPEFAPPSRMLHASGYQIPPQHLYSGYQPTFMLLQLSQQAPSAPTIVSVEATSSTSICIQWNASKKDGGSPITGYIVEYRPTSSPASPFETLFVEGDVSSTTLDDLTPSTEYEVRVRGKNAVGHSVPSATMRTKTKADSELQGALRRYTVKAKPTGKELGSGTYGRVIELLSAGEIVAGKVFKTSSYIHQQTLTNKLFGELSLMTKVHHPNIVQCKGVCLLESEAMPVLLMERLMSSLHAYVLDPTNSDIELVRKLSILYDVTKGLVYLHNQNPAIIHRDLTGNNVLLDSELRAKISDFGNARIMDLDPEATPGIFTALPGTTDYMPPEAQGAQYGPSLDVFSFGHLSLFTINQSLVHPLLPSTYIAAEGLLHARSEAKRREQYLDRAEQLLGEKHSLVLLIKQCLHNSPAQRPPTVELVTKLQDILGSLGEAKGVLGTHPQPVQQNPPQVQLVGASQLDTSQQVREPNGRQQPGIQSQGETGVETVDGTTPLDEDDLHGVISAVVDLAGSWRALGIALKLRQGDLDTIHSASAHSPSDCLGKMLTLWLRQNYNVERFGKPTWRRLVEAVEDRVGGNNSALAKKIAAGHPGSHSEADN